MRLLVTGGRDFDERGWAFRELDRIHREMGPITLLIHGAAMGADRIADEWARARRVERLPVPARWGVYKGRAGPLRNAAMLQVLGPDDPRAAVLAFPGGKGTGDMTVKAVFAGVPVLSPRLEEWAPPEEPLEGPRINQGAR